MSHIQEVITQNLHQERRSRVRNTCTTLGLVMAGVVGLLPLVTTINPVELVTYCPKPCKDSQKQVGIARLVDQERINSSLFRRAVQVVDYQKPDQPSAGLMALVGSGLVFSGLGVFHLQTKRDLLFLQQKFLEIKKVALIAEYSADQEVAVAIHQVDAAAAQATNSATFWLLNQLPKEQQGLLGAAVQNEVDLHKLQYEYQQKQLELETTRLEVERHQLTQKLSATTTKKLSPVGELIDQLQKWEDGWLSKLISGCKPIILTGCQGSGKTWTASTMAIIRAALGSQVDYLLDRHYQGDNQHVWSYLTPNHAATNETEIESAMVNCIKLWSTRIAARPKDKIQVIVDEFTHLPKLVGDTANKFIELALSDTRKAGCQVLLISHNLTNNSFGNGTKEYRTNGTVAIKKYSNDGEKPLDRITVLWGLVDQNGNDLKDAERTLPQWFQPQIVYDHLYNNKPINFGGS